MVALAGVGPEITGETPREGATATADASPELLTVIVTVVACPVFTRAGLSASEAVNAAGIWTTAGPADAPAETDAPLLASVPAAPNEKERVPAAVVFHVQLNAAVVCAATFCAAGAATSVAAAVPEA